jgi:hypothetical protein
MIDTDNGTLREIGMHLLSPEIDLLIEASSRWRSTESTCAEILERVRKCYHLLEKIEPRRDGNDSVWSLWVRTERGRLEDFGDYEEFREAGEVESPEEFEELWKAEYPEQIQWRRFSVVRYRERLFFGLGKLHFNVDLESGRFSEIDVTQDEPGKLVSWLMTATAAEARRFLEEPQTYNDEIARDLPLGKRFGRIRRRKLWEASPEFHRHDEELGQDKLEHFGRIVRAMDDTGTVPTMTLAGFLEACRICYLANDYERIKPEMTPRQMYRAMADNRDDGLLEVSSDDPEAFSRWYRERQLGGHPWEICRGGNRTHISLYAMPLDDGWQFRLAGFSDARAVETARMSVALAERGLPVVLDRREEMLRMLTGEDFVGIVPDDLSLGYNHGDFPAEDRIHSFLHLYMIEEVCDPLPEGIFWYPLEKLEPVGF